VRNLTLLEMDAVAGGFGGPKEDVAEVNKQGDQARAKFDDAQVKNVIAAATTFKAIIKPNPSNVGDVVAAQSDLYSSLQDAMEAKKAWETKLLDLRGKYGDNIKTPSSYNALQTTSM
jgi:hypothetical protein